MADPAKAKTVAAVDIGSNLIRMAIAQVLPDGSVEMLEQLQRAARLGQDTFRRGRIGSQAMRAAVAVLRDYRKLLDFYKAELIRAVATSAVREAGNTDTFLDRVYMSTGLDVAVIDTSEESRLTVSAVRPEVSAVLGKRQGTVLIADVGGGSTLLTTLQKGEISSTQSLRLGSIRLQEGMATRGEAPERAAEILRQQISNVVSAAQSSLPLKRARTFVAVGGDARFAAKQVGEPTTSEHLHRIPRQRFDELVAACESHAPEQLAKRHGLSFADAETLNPALLVYQTLLHATRASEVVVSHASMRDGLLLDLAAAVTGQEDKTLTKGVIHSAMAVAEKYRVDVDHARSVAALALRLFDELQHEHGLAARHRLLLHVAALVHEVGGFVSSRAHHKHGYYLVANSEIFGLTREEIQIVALIARYHRRSCPKPSHGEYMSLPRDSRMLVSKLAAILRVADALDRAHARQVRHICCEVGDEELLIRVDGPSDLTLERRAILTKGDLFQDVYGMKVRLEEADLPAGEERRAGPVE
jgi:exopolyphosphatase/guanosine-5'-triphosphate,3'-diphosphate pyrophosphatase